MLQFLLADYLVGYGLPSLRKTVIKRDVKIIWNLTSQSNTYNLTSLKGAPILSVIDTCHCSAVAIRLDSKSVVISLLEDRSERMINIVGIPDHGMGIVVSGYLTEGGMIFSLLQH
jgi:hypothetical protein